MKVWATSEAEKTQKDKAESSKRWKREIQGDLGSKEGLIKNDLFSVLGPLAQSRHSWQERTTWWRLKPGVSANQRWQTGMQTRKDEGCGQQAGYEERRHTQEPDGERPGKQEAGLGTGNLQEHLKSGCSTETPLPRRHWRGRRECVHRFRDNNGVSNLGACLRAAHPSGLRVWPASKYHWASGPALLSFGCLGYHMGA